MNLKKLTQAVFEGLPSEYRWAAISETGLVFAYSKKPNLVETADRLYWTVGLSECKKFINEGFNTTDWQNSLIERLDVPKAADIDWSRQDVPEGATHYQPECEATNNGGRYFKDGFKSVFEPEMHAAWLAVSKSIDLTGVIEIPTKPEPQVDWSAAPEGATHWHDDFSAWYKIVDDSAFIYSDYDDVWDLSAYEISDIKLSQGFIARPESIHDVARSIEAARVAEQSERTYPHYFKDVSDVDAIDLYHVARLYDITDPALFHAFKKIACAGKRGAKDQAQDVQEAIDALKRWQELNV